GAEGAAARVDGGRASNLVQTMVPPPQMLMLNGVIAVAVYLAVVNHDPMYLGAIFAFMIMTQRVTMPVIQAAQAIVQIDEARAAILAVGHIINRPAEEGRSGRGVRTPVVGRIEFNEVIFSYQGTNSPALYRVSFSVPDGSV